MRRLVLLLIAVLALAPAASADVTITKASIRAYLLKDPQVAKRVKETIREGGEGAGIDRLVYGDLTGDGVPDVVVPIFSGGTAGDIAYYVLSTQGGKLHAIQRENSEYKVGTKIIGGKLQVTRPLYSGADPNCCPSHLEITLYRYDGHRLVLASQKRVRWNG
ncbi:MAG: hypothetical protein ABI317_16245 [Gaiellales bacterium]